MKGYRKLRKGYLTRFSFIEWIMILTMLAMVFLTVRLVTSVKSGCPKDKSFSYCVGKSIKEVKSDFNKGMKK